MNLTLNKLALGAGALAVAAFLSMAAGSAVIGAASAATLAPQAGLEEGTSAVTLAKKGHHHHHHHGHHHHGHHHRRNWGYGVGGLIIGAGYCSIKSEQCEDLYGTYSYSYRRCMRRAGC